MSQTALKNSEDRISTAYLKLMLAADPVIAAQTIERFPALTPDALDQEFIGAEIIEDLFPFIQALGVESITLHFVKQIQLSSHGPVGFAALSAPDLRSALQTTVDFSQIRTSLVETRIHEEESRLVITHNIKATHPLVRRWMIEISNDVTYAVIETVMAHDISAQTSIEFAHSRPSYADRLDEKYGLQCTYDCAANALRVPASWADVKSPLSDQSSYLDNVAKCRSLLLALDAKQNSVGFVTHHLEQFFNSRFAERKSNKVSRTLVDCQLDTSTPSLPDVASIMAVSGRTLARRLGARGTSYKIILNQTRDQLAKQWLTNTHLTVSAIAAVLAYQEAANFTRAFKQRQGVSPQLWRKTQSN